MNHSFSDPSERDLEQTTEQQSHGRSTSWRSCAKYGYYSGIVCLCLTIILSVAYFVLNYSRTFSGASLIGFPVMIPLHTLNLIMALLGKNSHSMHKKADVGLILGALALILHAAVFIAGSVSILAGFQSAV